VVVGPGDPSAELRQAAAQARAAWPTLSLDEDAFARYLGGLVAGQPPDAWRQLRIGDLYLARACAEGDPRALALFEERIWPEVEAALAKSRLPSDKAQDVMQNLRVALFVRSSGRPGKIAQYRGQSDLRWWLRAAALRDAFRLIKKARRELTLDDVALASVAVAAGDPALARLKESCRVELKHAFAAALVGLPRCDRLLLRQHHLDRLTVDDLASLYRVHRGTVSRRVAKARQALADAMLGELGRRMAVAQDELPSLLRLVRSEVDVSLDRLLQVE
jgi:RNA polymerase sigma-70 factor, ECF subfamily